jgi:hypothetical protein
MAIALEIIVQLAQNLYFLFSGSQEKEEEEEDEVFEPPQSEPYYVFAVVHRIPATASMSSSEKLIDCAFNFHIMKVGTFAIRSKRFSILSKIIIGEDGVSLSSS